MTIESRALGALKFASCAWRECVPKAGGFLLLFLLFPHLYCYSWLHFYFCLYFYSQYSNFASDLLLFLKVSLREIFFGNFWNFFFGIFNPLKKKIEWVFSSGVGKPSSLSNLGEIGLSHRIMPGVTRSFSVLVSSTSLF